MEAKELRCGNLYNHNGEIREVTPSTIEEVWDAPRSWCKPIPLTEEWLERFGFKKRNIYNSFGYFLEVLKTDFYLRKCYMGGFYWGFVINEDHCELNDAQPIQYVHQLQNLYRALTGTELELKD